MNKTEHSPLPWTCDGWEKYDWDITDGAGINIFEFASKDDAQFIVTACNSYYENQSAIAELVEALTASTSSICKCNICTRGRALIAKHKQAGE